MNIFPRPKAFLIPLLLFFGFSILLICWFLFIPPSKASFIKVIYIKKGMNLRGVSALLEQEGVIRNRHFFSGIATLFGKKTEIKAGEYEFQSGMLPLEVLETLIRGQVKRHLVTIPEGYTLAQIAQLLEDLNVLPDKETLLQKATSPLLIASLGLFDVAREGMVSTLEGYLFPETYHFIKEMDPEEVIRIMTQQFKKVFGADLSLKASQLGISQKEAIILASIIEKETSLSEEKPLISAVFHNRLKKKIPLQSDPTVIYGIKNFDGNLTKAHLMKPTPYNTYLINGLPPSPICNPGKESILAALAPASVPYLYFVSKNDGSHYFSSDIGDHDQAVWKYQKIHFKKNLTKK